MEIFVLKTLVVGKLNLFSGMSNDALNHREALKGLVQAKIIKKSVFLFRLLNMTI